eukprot:6235975-Pyramimonas_sp.AAC.1
MDPSQTSFFQTLNIATKINKGSVEILNPVTVVTKGEKAVSTSRTLRASALSPSSPSSPGERAGRARKRQHIARARARSKRRPDRVAAVRNVNTHRQTNDDSVIPRAYQESTHPSPTRMFRRGCGCLLSVAAAPLYFFLCGWPLPGGAARQAGHPPLHLRSRDHSGD